MKPTKLLTAIISYLLIFQWLQLPQASCASAYLPGSGNGTGLSSYASPVPVDVPVRKILELPMASIAKW